MTLLSSQRTLCGPNQSLLPVKGQFSGKIRVGKRATEQTIYVVEGLHKSLLGKPAVQALQLLKRIGAVEMGSKPEELFPNLFSGLGNPRESIQSDCETICTQHSTESTSPADASS